jgi:peroxiredoxin
VPQLKNGWLRSAVPAPDYLNIPAIGDFEPSMKISNFVLFLDSTPLVVDAVISEVGIEPKSIKGSPLMDDSDRLDDENEYTVSLDRAIGAFNSASEVYNKSGGESEENLKLLEEANELLTRIQEQKGTAFFNMISKYPKSKALASHVVNYYSDASTEEKKSIIAGFDPSIHSCYALSWLADAIRLEENTAVGSPMPDFDTYTIDGKLDKLSNYRGEYLLIDFWASWCGPCIEEIPNIKSIYRDYKDKGLKVIGVSTDESKDNWLKSIKEHNLAYYQLRDPDWKSGKLLNYQGIPFVILVSPDGIILERDLRGEETRNKVKQHLN